MDQITPANSDATLSARLAAVASNLRTDAEKVLTEAGDILDETPGQQQALLLLVSALKLLGSIGDARKLLEWMAERQPKLASVQFELGLVLCNMGLRDEAIACLNRVVELEPNHAAAWRALGNQLSLTGDTAAAASAYRRHLGLTLAELKLVEDAMEAGKDGLVKAENMLRTSVDVNKTDASMVRMLGLVYMQLGDYWLARNQFARALELMPTSVAARGDYAEALYQGMAWREAIEQLDLLTEADPDNGNYAARKADNLVLLGEYDRAFELLEKVRPKLEKSPRYWLNFGHNLRVVGRSEEAIEAYRTCLRVDPGFGSAWWGLANLKTYRFSPADIESMLAALAQDDLDPGNRISLEFAAGQALEHEKKYAESFEHYAKANVLRRETVHHDPNVLANLMKKSKALYTPEFFRARNGLGSSSPAPIFILGMVRAGSTLIEQILSSHSLVEGTMELPDFGNTLVELIESRKDQKYPELIADLDGPELKALGEKYLEMTRCRRILDRPFFTDKTGTNLWRTGLIHLTLPNAKIIDARRHPLGCCFSAFKQNFPGASTPQSYDMTELGRYYRDYVELMAHFDKVLPGRVHRVFHEDMIRDPEREIRRLLDYCGLPFEETCLRFHETKRAVRTVSSEQVRKPVSEGSSGQWRHYEPWLGPLKDALGDVLTLYPNVPEFR